MRRHEAKRGRGTARRRTGLAIPGAGRAGRGVDTNSQEAVDPVEVAPHATRDRGGTLIELLVTIVIMGVVLAPVMDAVLGAIRASSTNRGLANVETALHNAADKVNRARRGCDYTVFAAAAAQSQGWPSSAATVQQFHYVPGSTSATLGTWASGACPATGLQDLLVQMVSITMRNPDTGTQRTIQVVKSDV